MFDSHNPLPHLLVVFDKLCTQHLRLSLQFILELVHVVLSLWMNIPQGKLGNMIDSRSNLHAFLRFHNLLINVYSYAKIPQSRFAGW